MFLRLTPEFSQMIASVKHRYLKPTVKLLEVSPRDGLQNLQSVLSVDKRVELIRRLEQTGLRHIEVGSVVNNKLVPQLANSLDVVKQSWDVDANMSLLVPSQKQLVSVPKNIDEIVLFASVTDTFNRKNINTDVDGAFKRFKDMIDWSRDHHRNWKFRGSISCVWGCPYEGRVELMNVVEMIRKYERLGVDSIDLCDTIGAATPSTIEYVLNTVMPISHTPINLHLHDHKGLAIENAMTAVDMGVYSFHSSIGGLGGCPFSPTSAGNLDTLELVERLHSEGYPTGVDLFQLQLVWDWLRMQIHQA